MRRAAVLLNSFHYILYGTLFQAQENDFGTVTVAQTSKKRIKKQFLHNYSKKEQYGTNYCNVRSSKSCRAVHYSTLLCFYEKRNRVRL